MKTYTKQIWKMIREWHDIAYQRELNAELSKLYDQFYQWKIGKMDAFDLSQAIHKFHDETARQLYSAYVMSRHNEDSLLVAAVARGFISEEELPTELVEALKPKLSLFDKQDV